jgi:hypothetical protein
MTADPVTEVLAMIEELTRTFERDEEALGQAAQRLTKPSRADLEAMRDLQRPVTPEAFLLARLHRAAVAVEDAWSCLQSIDGESLQALEGAFAEARFPGLVQFRDLAAGAGELDLANRALPAAPATEAALRRRGLNEESPSHVG